MEKGALRAAFLGGPCARGGPQTPVSFRFWMKGEPCLYRKYRGRFDAE